MRGAIPLLPNTRLHDINRNNFTFTGTVLFASSPCPESTQLSYPQYTVGFFTNRGKTSSTVNTICTVTAFIKQRLHYKQSVLHKHNKLLLHKNTALFHQWFQCHSETCGTTYECHTNTHDRTYYSEPHLRILFIQFSNPLPQSNQRQGPHCIWHPK